MADSTRSWEKLNRRVRFPLGDLARNHARFASPQNGQLARGLGKSFLPPTPPLSYLVCQLSPVDDAATRDHQNQTWDRLLLVSPRSPVIMTRVQLIARTSSSNHKFEQLNLQVRPKYYYQEEKRDFVSKITSLFGLSFSSIFAILKFD